MAIDREKTYAAGQKYLQRGQLDKAIVEFERLMADDPSDLRTLLKIGDMELKRGNSPAARRNYVQVADAYVAQGFLLKAVAVYKQLGTIDSQDTSIAATLASLYEQLGLLGEAAQQYTLLADLHETQQDWPQLEEALQKLRSINLHDADVALRLAEVFVRTERTAEAKQLLGVQAKLLHENEHWPDWTRVAERLLSLDGELAGLACQLARYYMDNKLPREALAKLRIAFHAAPQDSETLQLLAQTFEALGQNDKAVAVLKELGHQAQQRGQLRALERILQQLVRLDAQDGEHALALARLQGSQAQADEMGMRRGVRKAETEEAPQRPLELGDVPGVLTEARIFVRYHLRRRARDYLARILAVFPENAEAKALDDGLAKEERRRSQMPAATAIAAATATTAAPSPAPQPMAAEDTAQSAVERVRQTEATVVAPEPVAHTRSAPLLDESTETLPGKVEVFRTLALTPSALTAERLKLAEVQRPSEASLFDGDAALSAPEPGTAQAEQQRRDGDAAVSATLQAIAEQGAETRKSPPSIADVKDPQTHFELGVAYQDMGLFDDAIEQYRMLVHLRSHAADAYHALGACHLQLQQAQQAADALEEGLRQTNLTQQQQLVLHYELSLAYDALHVPEQARQHRDAAAAIDPNHRDLAARRAQETAPEAAGETATTTHPQG